MKDKSMATTYTTTYTTAAAVKKDSRPPLSDEEWAELSRKVADALRKEQEDFLRKALYGDSEFDKAVEGEQSLTPKLLQRLVQEELRRMEEPFRALLREAGFDEDEDWIFLPDTPMFEHVIIPRSLKKRVRKTPYATSILLAKNLLEEDPLRNIGGTICRA